MVKEISLVLQIEMNCKIWGKGLEVKSFLSSYGIKLEDFDDVDWKLICRIVPIKGESAYQVAMAMA